MLGIFLIGAVAAAIANGDVENEEEYCNQYACNYEDIYETKRVRSDEDLNDRFVGWADDDDEY